ncbi:helix-turn-helix domain-containing protein [Anaerorhabdus furcosa]|uniref:Helix-turn-helix n=1 Tax=Anaerorhabdus furcosa TaxID=118967 RepID=A0A1T4N8G6_9FIRM|nr:helix-turn-helix transcriptional regulator [Anaerorhabdus furcosa]SJZ75406.1 Helix-turn-helix [Anaerorhabdus furcosa]
MKINEVIKTKRKELGLTQEEIATALHVSTPAVNKWESGNSYPDITQLPSLARLLKVDMNTLLDFKKELSREEMGEIVNRIGELGYQDFEKAYEEAMDALYEYPNNDELAVSIVAVLKGLSIMVPVENIDKVNQKINELLMLLIESDQVQTQSYAAQLLVANALQEKNFEDAYRYLDKIPENKFDKKPLELTAYMAENKLDEALKLIQREVYSFTAKIERYLFSAFEIAALNKNIEDRTYYKDLLIQFNTLFGINEYMSKAIEFRECFEIDNRQGIINSICEMAIELEKPIGVSIKKVYDHLEIKDPNEKFSKAMIQNILLQATQEEKTKFLLEEPQFLELLAKYDEASK